MAIKNEKDLEKMLASKFKAAIKGAQKKSVERLIDRVNAFYADLPESEISYSRTYQLNNEGGNKNFIDKSDITKTDGGYEAEVSLNPNTLHYDTGRQPSGEQVVGAAVDGWHGATGMIMVPGHKGIGIWDESFQKKATDDLIQELIAKGIPIVKG